MAAASALATLVLMPPWAQSEQKLEEEWEELPQGSSLSWLEEESDKDPDTETEDEEREDGEAERLTSEPFAGPLS